ncbi:MAG: hypothetical protein QM484_14485 [Woeseiaceae bacterium]
MSENEDSKNAALSAAVIKQEEDHYVLLPCSPSDFGGFVSGLLGKSQVLRGAVEGVFDVQYQEIENVFHLVSTRVNEQNEGALTHFSITVHYDNGTSITHNDVKKFKTYNPVDACHPFEVVLNFTYLISFPNKGAPEKQEIQVAMIADSDHSMNRERHYMDGAFEYEIQYTNRTWATDISSLLKNHGETFIEKTSKLKRVIRRYNDTILTSISAIVMIFVIIGWSLLGLDVSENFSSTEVITGKQITDLLQFTIGGLAVISVLAITLNLITKFSEYHIYQSLESFIVLVERDRKRREKLQKKIFWKWLIIISTWGFSIVAGLVANYINHAGYFMPG